MTDALTTYPTALFAGNLADIGDNMIGLVVVILLFGWPVIGLFLRHQRQMMELRLRGAAQADANLQRELQELKQQLSELRDTTTRYDMSFDSALQRLETRMGTAEQNLRAIAAAQPAEANRS